MSTLVELSKAVRPYDPEDKRQRNSAFLPGLAAGGAVATGAQTARQFEPASMKTMSARLRRMEAPVHARGGVPQKKIQEVNRTVQERARALRTKGASVRASGKPISRQWYIDPKKGPSIADTRRASRGRAGKWGAATMGLAGLAALGYNRAASKKNRRWE